MFKSIPKIFAHVSSVNKGNFVLPEVILNKSDEGINLFHRFCPHRRYPLHNIGENVQQITCKLHGFEWTIDGVPINNDKSLNCGTVDIGKSGLVFKNFIEPDHRWVDDLSKEKNLVYSHSLQGKSKGSWLWMMEIQADLLHIRPGEDVVHPWLSSIENLEEVNMECGDGWVIQTCSTGWWLCIYPCTFLEWSPGCLGINCIVPDNLNSEFGFTWVTQFYYDPSISQSRRIEFEKLENAINEDVIAIEVQQGPYFPLNKSQNRLEDHCVHFGNWFKDNKLK
jgi:nitrite reductase/ring-hydroxylating ferredoxin subunit